MDNLVLAIALVCQGPVDMYPRSERARLCAKEILECYAEDKAYANNKFELLKLAKCLEAKKK